MKNPWLSMWLSAANTSSGAARGFLTAEMRRQQKAIAKEAMRASGFGTPAPKKRANSKRPKKARP
jgi:hypothetical protein